MFGRIFIGLLVLLASAAPAAETVQVGPVPVWVILITAPPPSPDAGGLTPRLVDIQINVDDAGVHSYAHSILKVLSPAALQVAGTVAFPWLPALGHPTFHRVLIHRGDQLIDVLKDGSGFQVIRRETGLENSLVDGQLTAVMQVPDLRVGDELETSVSISLSNPVLMGHVELVNPLLLGGTVDRLYLRYSWPAARPLRVVVGDALPRATAGSAGGMKTLTLDRAGFRPATLLAQAPARYLDSALVQLSDFRDWQGVADIMSPLFRKAATIPTGSPLHAEIQRIAAASADPKIRAALALQLVQGQVRYFADVTGLGALTPAPADAVWQARAGDCKGKTALLIAVLRGLDIDAMPALVSATRGNGVDRALPMVARFDHVLVRARIAGKDYWLDGTRLGDRDLEALAVPPFEWALPLTGGATALARLDPTVPALPDAEWRLDLDARVGIDKPAKATGEAQFRGEASSMLRTAFSLLQPADRDTTLRRMWQERHDWVKIDSVTFDLGDKTGVVRIGFTGTGDMDWNRTGDIPYDHYEANKARLGRPLTPSRDPEHAAEAPVAVTGAYEVTHQTILLPDGGKGFYLEGGDIDQTIGGVQYHRTATLKDSRFDMTASTRAKAEEISFADAKAADKAMQAVFDKQLFIHLPPGVGAAESASAAKPVSSTGFAAVERDAMALNQAGKNTEALARVDAWIATGHRDALSLRLRATALFALDRGTEANQALDEALALEPRNPLVLYAKADALLDDGRIEDAAILADRLILVAPNGNGVYVLRARVREDMGDYQGALADLQIALSQQPDDFDAHFERARLLARMAKLIDALAEIDQLIARVPEEPLAHALRGNLLALLGRPGEAAAALARSIALKPNDDAYVSRLTLLSRAPGEALADVLEVIALDPARPLAASATRSALSAPGAKARIEQAYAAQIALHHDDATLLSAISVARDQTLDNRAAIIGNADRKLSEHPNNPELLNQACWARATARTELDKAEAECDAAIAAHRNSGVLDSRGLVELQKGNFTRALADYDAALALAPGSSPSLYGRGIARARLGDKAGSAADLAAAHKIRASIGAEYASYGLNP